MEEKAWNSNWLLAYLFENGWSLLSLFSLVFIVIFYNNFKYLLCLLIGIVVYSEILYFCQYLHIGAGII